MAPDVWARVRINNPKPNDAPRTPLVRNMVELPSRYAARERSLSCGEWNKLVAHVASRSGQTFEPALVIELLLLNKEAQVKRHPVGNESPNESG